MRGARRGAGGRQGQAVVEFALVLPFLLVMLLGIVEFGQAWNQHQVITDAAREAVRKAAIPDATVTRDDVIDAARRRLAEAGIDPDDATITTPGWDGAPNTPAAVTIDLPYRFTFFGPLVEWASGQSNIVLKTSFTMRNE